MNLNNDEFNIKSTIMRLHFFTLKEVPGSFSIKDIYPVIETDSVPKQIDTRSNYRIIILIIAIALLLGIYSFIAYSFLETSSAFVHNKPTHTEIHHIEYKGFHYRDMYNTCLPYKKINEIANLKFFQNYIEKIHKNQVSKYTTMLCVSEKIQYTNSFGPLQENKEIILS